MNNEITLWASYGYYGTMNTVLIIRENEGLYELVNGYGEVMKTVTGLNKELIEFLSKLMNGELA